MEAHDTTRAVANAMYEYGKRGDMHRLKLSPQQDIYREAQAAIAADRQALEKAGYAIVKVGEPVPWMIGSVVPHAHELCDETCPLSPTDTES
jgi:hypothetical protein